VEENTGFSANYKRAIEGAEGDYIWTFGDDDRLLEAALPFMERTVKDTNFDFYHVAEISRVDRAEGACGTVFQLSNAIGFIDFTGFISGNVTRSDGLKAAVASEDWEIYEKSSYPQSLALMDVLAGRPAMMLELGMVETGTPDGAVGEQWLKQDTCWKYLYVADGLRQLVNRGVIPGKVNENFFRYLEGSLISRLVDQFNARLGYAPDAMCDADWNSLIFLVSMSAVMC
jgi:glycosyltransferase involved in cell wall biosynthesis